MKNAVNKFAAILGVIVLSTGFYSFNSSKTADVVKEQQTECVTCKYDQCHAIAKSTGSRCRHCVSNYGDIYCWQHK